MARRRAGIGTLIAALAVGVAFVAVLITGVFAAGSVRSAAQQQAAVTLARQADLVAATLDKTPGTRPARLMALLRGQQIQIALLPEAAASLPFLTSTVLSDLAVGRSVSVVLDRSGGAVFVEGRPLDAGGSVVIVQPTSVAAGAAGTAQRRLIPPLLLGLGGAALAGLLLARRLARPIQAAAGAANQLAAGARDVRLVPEGPAEVAELAGALNGLSAALATSEGREREFLLSVSHELRTPLTAVRGYAEALADGVVPPAEVERIGATMLAEAQRLDRLVADLLDLARLRAQNFRLDVVEVDLGQLVREAGQVWGDRCGREGVELRLEVPTARVLTHTDPTRVRQIIDGLAENALRVTPSGRPMVLAVRVEGGSSALVEVRDGGPGLSDDDLSVAFERSALYDRYHGVRQVGTGFGLALVAGLAARLGGTAMAGRSPEGGASFAVRLPLVATAR